MNSQITKRNSVKSMRKENENDNNLPEINPIKLKKKEDKFLNNVPSNKRVASIVTKTRNNKGGFDSRNASNLTKKI